MHKSHRLHYKYSPLKMEYPWNKFVIYNTSSHLVPQLLPRGYQTEAGLVNNSSNRYAVRGQPAMARDGIGGKYPCPRLHRHVRQKPCQCRGPGPGDSLYELVRKCGSTNYLGLAASTITTSRDQRQTEAKIISRWAIWKSKIN